MGSIPIKTPAEIVKMRASAAVIKAAFEHIKPYVRNGISTLEIDAVLEEFILSHGGKAAQKGYKGYPNASCTSVEETVVHGIPSYKRLKDGQIASVDIVVEKDGFHVDAARTFRVGDVDEKRRNLMRTAEEAFFKAAEIIRPGTRIGDISSLIQSYCESRGYGVVRKLTGHGIGRRMHEAPEVPNFGKPGAGPILKAGMTIAVEPMITAGTFEVNTLRDGWTVVTADGQPAAHYENTVLVTETGCEILTL